MPWPKPVALVCRNSAAAPNRRTQWRRQALLGLLLAAGCPAAAPPAVIPDPEPTEQRPPPPIAPPPVAPVFSGPPPIIVHSADLHGKVDSKQGRIITIRALLMVSKTKPALGNRGVLYWAPPGVDNESDWVALGEVEVQKPLDLDGKLQVQMVDDEKKFVIPGGKRPLPLSKSSRVKLRWEW